MKTRTISSLSAIGSRLFGTLTDGVNPIVVREVRRALRGNFLPAAFVNVQVLCLFVAMPTGQGDGKELLTGMLYILALLGGIVLPILSVQWVWEERRSGTFPVLLLTRLGVPRLFWGRFASGMVPFVLTLSATLPFVAFAYLLGGIGIGTVVATFSAVVLLSAFHLLCGVALAFAPRTQLAYSALWWLFAAGSIVSTFAIATCSSDLLLRERSGGVLLLAFVPLGVLGLVMAVHLSGVVKKLRVARAAVRERAAPFAVEVKNVHREYGNKVAVRDVNFRLEPGEIVGLIGSNGAGKSTVLRMMSTLERPSYGVIQYGDVSHTDLSSPVSAERVRGRIGYMPDRQGFYPNVTVAEYLDFFARAYLLSGEERTRAVAEVLEFAGLATMSDRFAVHLSKGMRQRLSFARAIIHDPPLLLLDEPMEGLDPRARIEFRELLRALAAQGKTIFISSHILAELGGLVDRVVILEMGRLATSGKVEDLRKEVAAVRGVRLGLRADQDPAAAERFLAAQPGVVGYQVDGSIFSVQLDPVMGEVDRLVHDLYAAGIRVEEIESSKPDLERVFLHHTKGELA